MGARARSLVPTPTMPLTIHNRLDGTATVDRSIGGEEIRVDEVVRKVE